MTCPDDDQLALHVEGALTPAQRAVVAEHLLVCGPCRGLAAALAAARTRSRHSTHSAVFPASTWRWEPGRRVGRFVLQGPLGRGGMGEVYEAIDTKLQRTVAIKVARSGGHDERVVREGRTLAQLHHANVIPVFDAGTHDGAAYIVMARASGSSLRRWLSAEPRSVKDVLELFRGVAQGCAAMHAIGIVHRDIKPDNILVGDDGQGMLSDFGLASPTRPGSGGTPGYIAPEVERGGEATEASDQYGFCVALDEALEACARGRIPRWARAVVLRGKRPDPADRFPTMDALVQALVSPSSTSRAVTLVLASVITVAVLARPSAEPCTWKDEPWPTSEDPSWKRLQQAWVTVATEACPANDQARACLLEQRHDAEVLFDAANAEGRPWTSLDPETCLHRTDDEQARQRARERVTQATAARLSGDLETAARLGREAVTLAHATGHPSLIAAALSESGTTALARGEYDQAAEQLESAHWMALRSDELGVAADSAIELVDLLSDAGHFDEARRWRNNASAALDRLDEDDLYRRAQVEVITSLLHQRLHEFEDAVAAAQRAHDFAARLPSPPESLLITIDARVGGAMQVAGDTEGAQRHLDRALERQLKLRGEHHPTTATIVYELAILDATNLPEPERAVERFRRALAIVDTPDSVPTHLAAKANENLAHTLISLERFDEARSVVERTGILFDALFPGEHPRRLGLYTLRANLAQGDGKTEEAWRWAEEGMLMANHTLGGRDPLTASMTATAGELAYNQGKHAIALQRFETAFAVFEEVGGPEHPILSEVLIRMGDAELGLGHREQAVARYERSLTLDMPSDARTRALLGLSRAAADPKDAARYAAQAELSRKR